MKKISYSLLLTVLNGLIGVVLGALGAHALETRLEARGMVSAWQTAGMYQLIHVASSISLIAWAESRPERSVRLLRVVGCWLVGCLLFSGSIYLLALGGPKQLGPVTPLGGLAFIAGWILLIRESITRPSTP